MCCHTVVFTGIDYRPKIKTIVSIKVTVEKVIFDLRDFC